MFHRAGASLRGEQFCKDGSVNISRNHLVLLQGLLDRPAATALGRWDCDRAARPYIRRYRGDTESNWILYHAIDWLPACWAERKRRGRYMSYRLRQRGREILDGRVPAKVSGRYLHKPSEHNLQAGGGGAS